MLHGTLVSMGQKTGALKGRQLGSRRRKHDRRKATTIFLAPVSRSNRQHAPPQPCDEEPRTSAASAAVLSMKWIQRAFLKTLGKGQREDERTCRFNDKNVFGLTALSIAPRGPERVRDLRVHRQWLLPLAAPQCCPYPWASAIAVGVADNEWQC